MKKAWTLLFIVALALGCGRKENTAAPAEEKTYAVTRWSDKTELFMEYPVLVAGETHRFAVHFTDLRDFSAQTEGSVAIELRRADSAPEAFAARQPSRPGIFGVDVVAPSAAGRYQMSVILSAPGLQDRHDISDVEVYATAADAARAPEQEEAEATKFLKEQQWNLPFATEVAEEREMRESLTVPGEVRPRSGGESELTATISGRLSLVGPSTVGIAVERGQLLAEIVPTLANMPNRAELESASIQAESELELARKDRERAERLLAARAVPAKRLDEARAAEAVAETKYKLAQTNLEQMDALRGSQTNAPASSVFGIRAPISGVLAEVAASPGSTVQAGQRLFRVVATDTVHVVAAVPESEAEGLRNVAGGEVLRSGNTGTTELGRPLSASRVVDPLTRTLTVVFRASNKGSAFAVGQTVQVRVFRSHKTKATAIPESAVVDDAGQPVVFVQLAGESFARRAVSLGARESGYVQVQGIKPGERIVSQGAYLIRLAALSGQIPAHGHVH